MSVINTHRPLSATPQRSPDQRIRSSPAQLVAQLLALRLPPLPFTGVRWPLPLGSELSLTKAGALANNAFTILSPQTLRFLRAQWPHLWHPHCLGARLFDFLLGFLCALRAGLRVAAPRDHADERSSQLNTQGDHLEPHTRTGRCFN